MRGLSKSKIMSGLQCKKRLWLEIHAPDLLHWDDSAEARFRIGHEVGAAGQSLFPEGVLIEPEDGGLDAALRMTQDRLDDAVPLFEATFSSEGALVRVDVLAPEADGRWRLIEIKAATSMKEPYYPDCAIQAWVLRAAGLDLASVELAHVDNSFVYRGGRDYDGLLRFNDLTGEIEPLVADVEQWIEGFRAMLEADQPVIDVGPQCHDPYECPFLDHCTPPGPEYPLSSLIGARKLAAELQADGYEDLREVPESRVTQAKHLRQLRAIKSGEAELDPAAGAEMTAFDYPRYYLDYETVALAVPIWVGTRPYQVVPFQFSVHVETAPGETEHHECLPVGGEDPRREIAERLIESCGKSGPIFMYTAYETRCTRALADACPDLASDLEAIIVRLVDLHPITKRHYYHPAMQGSFSMKAVAPTLSDDLNYAELEDVADGGQASEAYLEILSPDTPAKRRDRLIDALLTYCKLDTWAMVRLASRLQGGGAT